MAGHSEKSVQPVRHNRGGTLQNPRRPSLELEGRVSQHGRGEHNNFAGLFCLLMLIQGTLAQAQVFDVVNDFDFVGLHNISKHITYLTESANAILAAMGDMQEQHAALRHVFEPHFENTARMLAHRKSLIRSTGLRLASLEKRMQGILNLVIMHLIKSSRTGG